MAARAVGDEDRSMVKSVLVVASRTASSLALLEAMCELARVAPTRFTLLIPGGAKMPPGQVDGALARQLTAGLTVELVLGDADPIVAVRDAWGPASFDEIIVSTLPEQTSRWMRIGLPFRIEHITGTSVRHVTDDADDCGVDAVPVARSRGRVRHTAGDTPRLLAVAAGH